MTEKRLATHKQVWVKNEVYEVLESFRIRDETPSSIIADICAFYLEHQNCEKGEKK